MYGPQKFPKKPRVTTLNGEKDGEKGKLFSQWGYAPSHAYYPPWEKLEKFQSINLDQVVKDVTPKEKVLFDYATSYRVATKAEKQRDAHFKILQHVRKQMPNLTAYDLKKDGIIRKIMYFTIEIQNFQEDLHQLYSIRRYENQRNLTKKYQNKRRELILLLNYRSQLLAQLKSLHHENYVNLLKTLNIENIEPARKPLPYPNHLQQKEILEKHMVGRAAVDGRLKRSSHYLTPYSAHFMDQNSYHRENTPSKHTAAIIDMRIRTFYEMEQQEERRIKLNKELDSKTKANMIDILTNYKEKAATDEKAAVWNDFLDKTLQELKKA